jgi:hypothetical protein
MSSENFILRIALLANHRIVVRSQNVCEAAHVCIGGLSSL